MKNFLNIHDVEDVNALVKEALYCKRNPKADNQLGKNKTLGLPPKYIPIVTIINTIVDKKIIKEIRQNVQDHERKVKEHAEDLERARLKEAQAEKLKMEAEKLRGKEKASNTFLVEQETPSSIYSLFLGCWNSHI